MRSLLETSLMLALRPELVKTDRIPADGPAKFPVYDRVPFNEVLVPPSGVLADARGSRAEIGEWMIKDHVELVTAALRDGFEI